MHALHYVAKAKGGRGQRFTEDRCRQAILVCLPLSYLTRLPRSQQGRAI